jgi:D-alanyl-D-alanine carboxypeptidase (penicillin-binding protein 5/6)
MEIAELQKIAERHRATRETGYALLGASVILGLFLIVPLLGGGGQAPVAAATSTPAAPDAYADVPLQARAAIVYDLSTGVPLFEKNADAQLPLASLTKLLTVYAAFSELPPSATVQIPADAAGAYPPRAFNEGQAFALSDLARLTLTGSLNDGAIAIADAAAERANKSKAETLAGAAAALSLSQTYAVNGSGLDENESVSGGYGSAKDIATLAGALVSLAPSVAAATTEKTATATSLGGTTITVKNTDPIVESIPHLLLSKTGFTDLAGGNLALVFDAGINHPVAVVVLGSTQDARFTDASALVAATFAHFAGVGSL